MIKKKKKSTVRFKLQNTYQRTMIKIRKEMDKGLIKTEKQRKERFNEIYQSELAKEVTKIREETKQIFFRAVIVGAGFAVLVSFFINSLFKVIDEYFISKPYLLYLAISGVLLVYMGWYIYRKMKDLEEGRAV